MDNSIYEVERGDYVGFLEQIRPDCKDSSVQHFEDTTVIKVFSRTTGMHLATRIIPEAGPEHYYVFTMPLPEERCDPKPVQQVELKTREEVQKFFDILSKIQKEKEHD